MYTEIGYEVADGVATITLDRPDRLNAFTPVMVGELTSAFDRADADDEVRVVVVTRRGRAFCAGADLALGGATSNADSPGRRATVADRPEIDGVPRDGGVSLRVAASLKPVIAAHIFPGPRRKRGACGAFSWGGTGPAVGVGVTMTLPMDVRIAAASARFGFGFTRRGIVPESASSWFLPRVVGISQAMEWVATGRVFDAEEARAGGLVSRVCPDAEHTLAREIADNTSGVAVATARRLLWSMLGAPSPWEAHRLDSRAIHELGRAADAAEGVTAFLAKRPARFPLRVSADLPGLPSWPG